MKTLVLVFGFIALFISGSMAKIDLIRFDTSKPVGPGQFVGTNDKGKKFLVDTNTTTPIKAEAEAPAPATKKEDLHIPFWKALIGVLGLGFVVYFTIKLHV